MTRHRSTLPILLTTCVALLAGGATAGAATPDRGAPSVRVPLHTQGRWIVDRRGDRVKLASVNWFGAESAEFVVGGLDKQPLSRIVRLIKRGGFNSVRLPWSNQLVEQNPVVSADLLAANRRLQGKRALDVLDAVIREAGRQGLMVILDNHRSRADWCCDEDHGDGLWYTREYPESAWIADWRTIARRYRHSKHVVAAELRNEIRPDPSLAPGPTTATWGDGDPLTDWRAAAERGGDAVLAANPRLLVIVGGTEYQGNLTGVAEDPVRLRRPHRVVYAPHDYRWFHSNEELADYGAFKRKLDQRWGYLLARRHRSARPERVRHLHEPEPARAVRSAGSDLHAVHHPVLARDRHGVGLLAPQRHAVRRLRARARRRRGLWPAQRRLVGVRQPDRALRAAVRAARPARSLTGLRRHSRYAAVTAPEPALGTLRPMKTTRLIVLTATIVACAATTASARPAVEPVGGQTSRPSAANHATIATHHEQIFSEQWQRSQAQPTTAPLNDRTPTDGGFPIVLVLIALTVPLGLVLLKVAGKPVLAHGRRRRTSAA